MYSLAPEKTLRLVYGPFYLAISVTFYDISVTFYEFINCNAVIKSLKRDFTPMSGGRAYI